MKMYFIVISLIIAAPWLATAAENKAPSLTVMTWNIRYANPRDGVNVWKNRKDWVAEIIKREKVDILGMQEVLPQQLRDLKRSLPEMEVYGVGRDDGKARGEQVPIMYRKDRFELLAKSTFWLSKTPEKAGSRDWDAAITRIASWVKLRDKSTKDVFYVINTHFDHIGKEARAKSAELLLEQMRTRFNDYPVILTGDFNTTPRTTPYKTLTTKEKKKPAFVDALRGSTTKPEGPSSTWNGFSAIVPNRRIDFIFVTDAVKVQSHRTLDDHKDGRFPSDHLPIVTKLELTKPSGK